MTALAAPFSALTGLGEFVRRNGHGFLVSAVIAAAAQFLSEHYGAPAMLMALLLGIAFHFLAEEGPCRPGIEFTARTVLRFGVALLGARISVELMIGLGPRLIAVVVAGVVLTILFGLLGARLLGRDGPEAALGRHLRFGFTLDTRKAERDLDFRPADRIGMARAGDGALRLATITT